MNLLLNHAMVYRDGVFRLSDLYISDGRIISVGNAPSGFDGRTVDCGGAFLFPGFTDVHVHFREPGFSVKERISTGCAAAARGGYTAVCTMPNLFPPPDSLDHLGIELEMIRRDATVRVLPYGTITTGEKGEELADLRGMAPFVAGFSDDGRGVQSREIMREAMRIAAEVGKPIVAHCEDESLLHGGYVHDGGYAARNGHRGICSESEWGPIRRDLELVRETGCAYHVCHVSAAESVELIRAAKREGLNVTCETAPHYLMLCDEDLRDDGSFRMNPPIRSRRDRDALREGLAEGTVDLIATDHAPHTAEEKSRGLAHSLSGIVGLECAFPVLYTGLVQTGILPLTRLIDAMSFAPAKHGSNGPMMC